MTEAILNFLSMFAESFLNFALPILASMAAAWLFAKVREAWGKLEEKHFDEIVFLEEIAQMAVLAAEQSGLFGAIQNKKAYALDLVENALKERGIRIDVAEISAAIEAAVMAEFNKGKVS